MQHEKIGKVIYTDDGISNVRLIPTLLERIGYKVIEVNSEEELIAETTQLLPDLILIHYPLYGYPACWSSQAHQRLKMNNLTRDIPIIMLVRKSEPELPRLEVNAIIQLPIDVNELSSLLETYLPS